MWGGCRETTRESEVPKAISAGGITPGTKGSGKGSGKAGEESSNQKQRQGWRGSLTGAGIFSGGTQLAHGTLQEGSQGNKHPTFLLFSSSGCWSAPLAKRIEKSPVTQAHGQRHRSGSWSPGQGHRGEECGGAKRNQHK